VSFLVRKYGNVNKLLMGQKPMDVRYFRVRFEQGMPVIDPCEAFNGRAGAISELQTRFEIERYRRELHVKEISLGWPEGTAENIFRMAERLALVT
jgi:hypothetical protein